MENQTSNPQRTVRGRWIGVGFVIGTAAGIAFNNIAIGIAAGVILGSFIDLYRGFRVE